MGHRKEKIGKSNKNDRQTRQLRREFPLKSSLFVSFAFLIF